MSDKYVKDIFEKLEEIEKLHTKLRSMVPRMKNYETPNIPKNASNAKVSDASNSRRNAFIDSRRSSEAIKNLYATSKTNVKKLFDRDSIVFPSNYLKSSKWKKMRRNSMNYVSKQWRRKSDQVKDFLTNIIEGDMILVNRAAQTTDSEQGGINGPSEREDGKHESFLVANPEFQNRRRTLDRLLEYFNYSHDSGGANVKVSTDRHSFVKDEPRIVRPSLIPDKKTETAKIISSAERISVTSNKKH